MKESLNALDINYSKLNIESCFKNHYIIPEYQREYVWEDKEIEQLLSDLFSSFEENGNRGYFMGIFVVYGNRGNTLEVIDGQQRLTTFFIMMCTLIHMYEDNGLNADGFKHNMYSPIVNMNGETEDAFCLELQYEDATNCIQSIWNRKIPTDAELEKMTNSNKRLFAAYNIISKLLKQEYPDFNELKKFAMFVFKCLQFVQIETADIADALKIFETINQRGVGLSPMDLLKNLIFMQVNRHDFPALNTQWKVIIDKIDNNREKPLRFLRYFITSKYDISDRETGIVKGILSEDQVYNWLMHNNDQCHYQEKPFEFVKTIRESLDEYINAISPSVDTKGREYLQNIPLIAGSTYRLHTLLIMAGSEMDDETKSRFYQIIEALVYYYTVNRVKANEVERLFASWCADIRKVKNQSDLNDFVDNKLLPDFTKRVTNPRQLFEVLNLRDFQKYRIRFILARIAKYIDVKRNGGDDYVDISDYLKNTIQIEHIMPQGCIEYDNYGLDEENFEEYVGNIGNLTLLEKPLNTSIQAKGYDVKCETYVKSSYYLTKSIPKLETIGINTSADRINKKMKYWETWNKNSIEERCDMLYKLSEEIWNIKEMRNHW